MKSREAARSIFVSWDFFAGLAVAAIVSWQLRTTDVPYKVATEIFSISVSVLAIVFSMFTAVLAVLITAGDNAFVRFLEETKAYTKILWAFKVTLLLLFIALCGSIALFVAALPYHPGTGMHSYPKWVLMLFALFSSYALFAAIHSSLNAIQYAKYRAQYVEITMGLDESEGRS